MAFEQQCEQLINEFETLIKSKTITVEDFTKEIQVITKFLASDKKYISSIKDIKIKKSFLQLSDLIERCLESPGSLVFIAMSCDLIKSGEQSIRDLVEYLRDIILDEVDNDIDEDEFEDGFDDDDLNEFDRFDTYD